MISVDEARALLLARARPVTGVQCAPLSACAGRVLAEAVVSTVDVPPCDNSAMDGYAVAAHVEGRCLTIGQRIPAGVAPVPLAPDTAARIFTGAAMPDGANAVVIQEDATEVDGTVTLPPVAPGANVRRRGQDVQQGAVVLEAGARLWPWHLGLAASVGAAQLPVREPLTVAIFSTGDELQEPGESLRPGHIYNSNRYMLRALLETLGITVHDLGVIADNAAATRAVLARAAGAGQVVISTGGVSVGEEDHIRRALDELGEVGLYKVNIKPGKPFTFGQLGQAFFMGLPGNPASMLVTFLLLVRPFLVACQGGRDVQPQSMLVAAGWQAGKAGKRDEYLRVRLEDGCLQPHPNQSSGMLSSACWAGGLARVPAGVQVVPGMTLAYYPFASMLYGDSRSL